MAGCYLTATNMYAYANGNPVMMVDPSGESAVWNFFRRNWLPITIGAAVLVGIAAITTVIVVAGAVIIGGGILLAVALPGLGIGGLLTSALGAVANIFAAGFAAVGTAGAVIVAAIAGVFRPAPPQPPLPAPPPSPPSHNPQPPRPPNPPGGGPGYHRVGNIRVNTVLNTGAVTAGQIRYVSQWPTSTAFHAAYWGSWNPTVGCAVASASMALSFLGINMLPFEIANFNNNIGMSTWNVAPTLTNVIPVNPATNAQIDAAIRRFENNPARYAPPILREPGNGFPDHFIVAVGISGTNYLIIDPARVDRTSAPRSRFTRYIQYYRP